MKHSLGVVDPEGNIIIGLIRHPYNVSIYLIINSILHNINNLMKKENVNVNNSPSSIQIEGNIPYELFVRATKLSCKTVSELMTKFLVFIIFCLSRMAPR
jgi:hypothetical protein